MILRRIAERLARGRTIRRHMQVGDHIVPIHVSPDAQLKYLRLGKESFDRDLVELARAHLSEDSIAWDVGANVGAFSVAAATVAYNGRVIAIEADIWLAQLLRKTAREPAHGGRIEVLPCAIADVCSTARFQVATRGRASNSLESVGEYSQTGGGRREVQLVPTLTLDTLLNSLPAPNFIKIDVEGAEALVLRGAQQILSTVRPQIYAEVTHSTASTFAKMMNEASYAVVGKPGYDVAAVNYENLLFAPLEAL